MASNSYVPAQVRKDMKELLQLMADIENHPNWEALHDLQADGSWLIAWFGDLRMERLFAHFGVDMPDMTNVFRKV